MDCQAGREIIARTLRLTALCNNLVNLRNFNSYQFTEALKMRIESHTTFHQAGFELRFTIYPL